MLLHVIRDLLDAEVLVGADLLDAEVTDACGSDLMSDVLAFVRDQALLLTGLVNTQVVRTAEMMDMKCIVFVRGKRPDDAILRLAQEKGIAVMRTRRCMYESCGILYLSGLAGPLVPDGR